MVTVEAKTLTDFMARNGEQVNRLFTEMVETLPVAIYTTDAEGRLRYFNAAAAKLSGRVLVLGTDQWCVTCKLFLPDGTPLPHDQCPMAIALKGGEVPVGIECIAERPDGTRFWFTPYPAVLRDAAGQIIGGMNVLVEITDRKNAELEAIEASEKYRAIVETTPDCVTIIGRDGTLIFMNSQALAMMGAPFREAAAGKNIYDLIAPEDRGRFREFNERICSGERASLEFKVIGLEGVRRQMETHSAPLRHVDGTTAHFALTRDVTERNRMDEVLRESEERFRNVANTAPVMIWAVGVDRLGTFFNKPWLDFRGRALEQELGKGWVEGVHPEDQDRCSAIFSSAFDTRRPFQKECRLRRADGEYRWVLDNGIPLYRAGEFAGFIGSCIDITEQKLIEERLRASEARLTGAQRLAKVGSWERHMETDRIHWSEEMLRILGMPDRPPASFSEFLNCVHPNDREKVLEADRKIRLSIGPVEVSYRLIRPDGEVRFSHSIAESIRSDHGALVRVVGATQDVTEQVRAQQLLRESEGRLKSAERLAHVGHWHRDLKSGHVAWSDECLRIFGLPLGYAPGQEEFFQLIAPQDREAVAQGARHCLEGKGKSSVEFRIVRPHGELRTVMSVSEVLLDEDGQPGSVFGAFQDITDVKRAQEETAARQKLESLGTLASGIAHDFNNLLGGTLAQAELALEEYQAGSSPFEELKRIRDGAIRGSEIVRQLMIYAGKESEAVGLVDVSQVARGMVELLKVSISKHARVVTDFGEDLPAVRGSTGEIQQIVMNLVTNASEALEDRDGVIHVTTRRVNVDRAQAISKGIAEGDYVQLEVTDTGPGMSLETQARVFDPFFTTKSQGHGLGLAVVRGVVRGLGGAINLASELGNGSTFQIFLRSTGITTGASGPRPTAGKSGPEPPATVLVVEDDEALRIALAQILRRRGFETLDAANGADAITLLRANSIKIDVMLLDMTIPGPSSGQVAAVAAEARPGLKVVLTSAYDEKQVRTTVGATQTCSFIRKPFQIEELVQTLRGILSVH